MLIPFLDLKRQFLEIEAEIAAATRRVLSGGIYILGPEVESFEEDWARFCGVAGAATVGNGTEALTLALLASRAVRMGKGDEVITSTLTSPYTALGIVNAGGVPVFVDINPFTYTLDPEAVERAITPRTRAIVPVHIYGLMADMPAICEIASRRDLIVIEDAAQAHGARSAKYISGSALAAAYSFYPTKNLGAYGDGGAVTSNDKSLIKTIKLLRQGGHGSALERKEAGRNSRLDEVQAAILRTKLEHLNEWNDRRRRLARMYTLALQESPKIQVPTTAESTSHAHHLYVIQHEKRDSLRKHLADQGIETMIHYPFLLHHQPVFNQTSQRPLPVAERVVNQILSLPLYPQLQDSEIEKVIESVRGFNG
jgi:dTDP-3-amino-3,4,6-trideoxy-alpha-D-glucose transaminase